MQTEGTEKIKEQAFAVLTVESLELTMEGKPTIKLGKGVMRLYRNREAMEASQAHREKEKDQA